jgi:hypothetical protein
VVEKCFYRIGNNDATIMRNLYQRFLTSNAGIFVLGRLHFVVYFQEFEICRDFSNNMGKFSQRCSTETYGPL